MATRTMSLGTHEIGDLKETLNAQQELLQKLYIELDVERESSATAADETLSMILRLQGEKAAMEMEAIQYKRIAEEKMFHAQETLETFQELIYQKEMQIASLEFQVQAYKFKLASLGFDDLASSELQYPEKILRRNGLVGEVSSPSLAKSFKRGYSLPPRVNALQRDSESYLEEIKKLDEKVKGFTRLNSSACFPTPELSLKEHPSESPFMTHDPSPDNPQDKMDTHVNSEESQLSTSVHDILEVPQCPEGLQEKDSMNIKLDTDRSSPNSYPKEIIDEEKQPLLFVDGYRSSLKRMVSAGSLKLKDERTERQKLIKHPTFGVADFELKQLNRRIKQLEDDRFMSRVQEVDDETGEEELKLLREIVEKVEAVQSELATWKTEKLAPPENRSFGCFKEVMLCFLP
ncbi:hypothetical protein vseg_000641 [Gypsophila vaccaria]